MAASRIATGMQDKLYLGNLSAQRDWGHARDYVRAMYLILQHSKPDDFVIGTGIISTVREFARKAFKVLGIDIELTGKGLNEKGIVSKVEDKKA